MSFIMPVGFRILPSDTYSPLTNLRKLNHPQSFNTHNPAWMGSARNKVFCNAASYSLNQWGIILQIFSRSRAAHDSNNLAHALHSENSALFSCPNSSATYKGSHILVHGRIDNVGWQDLQVP